MTVSYLAPDGFILSFFQSLISEVARSIVTELGDPFLVHVSFHSHNAYRADIMLGFAALSSNISVSRVHVPFLPREAQHSAVLP